MRSRPTDTMDRFRIGGFEVTRVPELCGPAFQPFALLPELPPQAVSANLAWLKGRFYDTLTELLIMSTHAWLVRAGGINILVESCGGSHKERPGYLRFNKLTTPFMATLAAAGVGPEDIHFVMCTHMHADHVGWNTRLDNGRWVPTFPNARYLISRKEYDNWHPATRTLPPRPMQKNAFEDSVLPVVEHGQADFIDEPYEPLAGLTIEPAYGHTLGHTRVRLSDGGEGGIFAGDIMHSPLQILYPRTNCRGCEDPEASRATRFRLLEDCADNGWLMMPAHFPWPYSAVHVVRSATGFRVPEIEPWPEES